MLVSRERAQLEHSHSILPLLEHSSSISQAQNIEKARSLNRWLRAGVGRWPLARQTFENYIKNIDGVGVGLLVRVRVASHHILMISLSVMG